MFRPFALVVLLAAAFAPATVSAQGPPVLLKEAHPQAAMRLTDASRAIGFHGEAFFLGRTPATGMELWKTDGTDEGTRLVKEFKPGPESGFSGVVHYEVSGGKLVITGQISENGMEVWTCDGTEAGTVRIKTMAADSTWAWPRDLTEVNGVLFFVFHDGLWRTDGTEAGTWRVKTGTFQNLAAYHGQLICQTRDADGLGLWRSDGTEAGTARIMSITPGVGSWAGPREIIATPGGLYFGVTVGEVQEIWKTDGTEAGTVRALPDSGIPIAAIGEVVFYLRGDELWRTDGTEEDNEFVAELPGFSHSFPLHEPYRIGPTLFLSGRNRPLWKTDGTPEGTTLVKDVEAAQMTSLNGVLYFASGTSEFASLWRSDGTPEGTVEVTPRSHPSVDDPGLQAHNLCAVGDTLYFSGQEGPPLFPGGPSSPMVMWRSDGTAAGTRIVHAGVPQELVMGAAKEIGGAAYFVTTAGAETALWRSDGTVEGTTAMPLLPAPERLVEIAGAGGRVFASWQTDERGATLSTYDSGGNPLVLLQEPTAGIHYLVESGGVLYFILQGDLAGSALWRSDGTVAGTLRVTGLTEGAAAHGLPQLFPRPGGGLLLLFNDGGTGTEIWKSDGTGAGTTRVKDLHALPTQGATQHAMVGDVLYFVGRDGPHGQEVWRTDGTEAGTHPLADLTAGPADSFVTEFKAAGNALFFLRYDAGANEQRLWRSDGTAAGTVAVMKVDFPVLTAVQNRVFFAHADAASGRELWASDGTQAGTHRVADIRPGPEGSEPTGITEHLGVVFFRANDGGVYGEELWQSDGTAVGTRMTADLTGDERDGAPDHLSSAGRRLFFSAVNATKRREPYVYDPTHTAYARVSRPTIVTPDTATLHAVVNAGGLPTTLTFYWSIMSPFMPGSLNSMPVTLGENGLLAEREVTVQLSGLTPGQPYVCYFVTENARGDSVQPRAYFTLPAATPLNYWLAEQDAAGGATGDKDEDGVNNLLEYAFGTDPAGTQGSPLVEAGGALLSRGLPVTRGKGMAFRGLFVRRKDGADSQLVYTPQFSADLVDWTDATTTPQILTGGDAEHELVSYPPPYDREGREMRFFRVRVTVYDGN